VAVIDERPPQALAATMRQTVPRTSTRFRPFFKAPASAEAAELPTERMLGSMAE
jgi:hypothetical protein